MHPCEEVAWRLKIGKHDSEKTSRRRKRGPIARDRVDDRARTIAEEKTGANAVSSVWQKKIPQTSQKHTRTVVLFIFGGGPLSETRGEGLKERGLARHLGFGKGVNVGGGDADDRDDRKQREGLHHLVCVFF